MVAIYILGGLTVLLAVATLLPFWREKVWWVRVWEFPRLQLASLALAVIVAGLVFLDLVEWEALAVLALAGAVFVAQAVWILPFLPVWPKEVQWAERRDDDDALRILCVNVLMTNRNAAAVRQRIRDHAPDVVVALETDEWWNEQLTELEGDYPNVVRCPLQNLYGIHVLSRLPFEDPELRFLVEEGIPSVHGRIILPSGERVWLHCLHPAPPSPTENEESLERDAELIIVGREVHQCARPVVVTGDLNDVAWSRTTRRFRRISGLLDPRIGRGMFNSFHAKWFFLRWPLDHFFHSEHFTVGRIERLQPVGSDHFPVLLELRLQPERRDEHDPPSADAEERDQARRTVKQALRKRISRD